MPPNRGLNLADPNQPHVQCVVGHSRANPLNTVIDPVPVTLPSCTRYRSTVPLTDTASAPIAVVVSAKASSDEYVLSSGES